ncbi:MAG TPA: hypothetical protein VHM91_25445, partial [Verrucomicrobiales bacterium]|nr:hypothetical protein [Verrucomicrobiales bacterium]
MNTRSACMLLCAFSLVSCKGEKGHARKSTESATVPKKAAQESSESARSACDFSSRNQVTAENVFSEAVLNSWGYITTEVAGEYHAIRSKKNYGRANEAFYARYTLAKARFENHVDASTEKSRIESLLKTDAGFKN